MLHSSVNHVFFFKLTPKRDAAYVDMMYHNYMMYTFFSISNTKRQICSESIFNHTPQPISHFLLPVYTTEASCLCSLGLRSSTKLPSPGWGRGVRISPKAPHLSGSRHEPFSGPEWGIAAVWRLPGYARWPRYQRGWYWDTGWDRLSWVCPEWQWPWVGGFVIDSEFYNHIDYTHDPVIPIVLYVCVSRM